MDADQAGRKAADDIREGREATQAERLYALLGHFHGVPLAPALAARMGIVLSHPRRAGRLRDDLDVLAAFLDATDQPVFWLYNGDRWAFARLDVDGERPDTNDDMYQPTSFAGALLFKEAKIVYGP